MIRSAKLACGGAVALMLLGGMICPAMAETNTDSAYGRVEQRIIENNPDFDIQLKYGLNGYAVNDRGSVIRLDIVCDTDFAGNVSVQTSYSEGFGTKNMTYARDVELKAGENTELEFYVDNMGSGIAKVEIKDSDGELVYSERDSLSIEGNDMVVAVGVMSDRQDAMSYIEDVSMDNVYDNAKVETVALSPSDIPESEEGLEAIEYLLVDDYDLSGLSEKQSAAMAETNTDSAYGRVEQRIIENNPDFDIQLKYGLNGYAVNDRGSVIRLDIVCDTDFAGNVSVQTSYSEGFGTKNMTYARDVELKAGENTELEFYVDNMGSGIAKVEIKDSDGELVYSERDSLSIEGNDMVVAVGVMSDRQDAMSYIEDVSMDNVYDNAKVETVALSPSDIPESEEGLEAIEYLLVDDYDLSGLSEKQSAAIKQWVYSGGAMILAKSSDENELSSFDGDFVSAVNDTQKVHELDGSDGYYLNMGYGRIVVLPYSLAQTDEKDKTAQAQAALEAGFTDMTQNWIDGGWYYGGTYYGYDVANAANKRSTPSPVVIMLVLIIYIIVCGPVAYIVLSRLKKKELIWGVIPVCAIIGTGAIYMVSLKYRVIKPIGLTFVAADISGDTKREDAYSYIIGGRSGQYKIDINSKYSNIEMDDSMGSSFYDNLNAVKNDGKDGVTLNYYSNRSFGTISANASFAGSNDIGRIRKNLTLYTDGFEGTLTNDTSYDVENLVVMSEGYYYVADVLRAGDTIRISRKNTHKFDGGSILDGMRSYYTKKYGEDYFGDDESSAEWSRNYYMQLRLAQYSRLAADDGVVAVWGTIQRDPDMMSDADTENYGSYMVYDIDTLKYEDVDGVYYYSIYDRDENGIGGSDYGDDDLLMYSETVDVNIRFGKNDDITELIYDKTQAGSGKNKVVVQMLNRETGEYDTVFADGQTIIKGQELDKYMSDGCLAMRFISPQQGDYYVDTYLPHISARGGVR